MKEEKAQKLLRFFVLLENQPPTTELFLVGDIFDLWLGNHEYFIEKFRPLADSLKRFIIRGGRVHYFEGNHDLHLQKFWEKEIGATVYHGPAIFKFDDITVRVEHGDEMDPKDRGYLFLRWLLRTPLVRLLIMNLPGKIVYKIGEWASAKSRNYTDRLRDEHRIRTIIHEHAQRVSREKPFDVIITGHVHLRDEFAFKNKISFNLGSWDDQPVILQFKDNKWTWEQI
ncbi:MAG: UDP-2,3-diacylglucosamine diphosphatase [Bdellovibrionales bacterium]|nr:UDP-2,3-diacylglucosamine diphosphatase [Bdellovibrionales bacterium]